MKECAAAVLADAVHLHDHVRERGHESPRSPGDSCAPDRRSAAIDRERSVLVIERRQTDGILAAPGCRIARSEVRQLCLVHRWGPQEQAPGYGTRAPMPPASSSSTIRYGPSVAPADNVMIKIGRSGAF